MGKKRVIRQTEEELAREGDALLAKREQAVAGAGGAKGVRRGVIHILATYNNTLLNLTDMSGAVLAWSSAGALGFKGTKKATPFAAARVSETVAEKAKRLGIEEVVVLVKGVGAGRESAIRALANRGIGVSLIKDITPVPHNGPRPKKVRRV
ncbi:30S ribosomal protein S11 [Candidatus Parcubacteria bacterium]|nr:MAG: 30S ribosomal protein S11 [Candidatus Parcubacteria bacterium]